MFLLFNKMNYIPITLSLFVLILILSRAQSNKSKPIVKVIPMKLYTITTFSNETVKCKLRVVVNGTKVKPQLCSYNYDIDALKARIPDYPIHPMILSRRFNYEQTGESITDEELFTLLEAMRWGPSDYNSQPWRIVYAHRGTPKFDEFLSILEPGNQVWNVDSAVLMIIVSDMYTTDKGNETLLHSTSFSTGAAFMGMALEASARGYLIHPMSGYDTEKAAETLGITDNKHFKVEVIAAIGKRGPPSQKAKKTKTDKISQRKKMSELVSRDIFKTDWIY